MQCFLVSYSPNTLFLGITFKREAILCKIVANSSCNVVAFHKDWDVLQLFSFYLLSKVISSETIIFEEEKLKSCILRLQYILFLLWDYSRGYVDKLWVLQLVCNLEYGCILAFSWFLTRIDIALKVVQRLVLLWTYVGNMAKPVWHKPCFLSKITGIQNSEASLCLT